MWTHLGYLAVGFGIIVGGGGLCYALGSLLDVIEGADSDPIERMGGGSIAAVVIVLIGGVCYAVGRLGVEAWNTFQPK